MKKKNIILAAILSFLIAGVGHFYLGLWKRGFAWLGGALLLGIVLVILFPGIKDTWYIGQIIGFFSALDARKQAEKINAVAR